MENEQKWEIITIDLFRIKVDGGHLYCTEVKGGNLTFVPDVDLQRYQAHLRDAYKKGYQDGQADHARNIDVYQEGYEQGVSDALEVVKTDAPPSTS